MSLLPPNAFDPPVDGQGRYSPAFLRFLEGLVNAINGLSGGATATPTAQSSGLRITGSSWILVTGNEADGFNVSQRPSLTTNNLPEGTSNLYYTDARAEASADSRIAAWAAAPALDPLPDAIDDAAAATAGVAVGGLYRNGSALMIRVA